MNRASVGIKLGIAFAFLISLLIGIGWLGLSRMTRISADLNEILDRRWAKVETARDAVFFANLSYGVTTNVLLLDHRDAKTIAALLAQRTSDSAHISAAQTKLAESADSDEERLLLARIDASRAPVNVSLQRLLTLLTTGHQPAEARREMVNVTIPLLGDYHEGWNTFIRFEVAQMEQAKNRAQQNSAAARRFATMLILLAIFVATSIAVFVTRKLVREIAQRERDKREIRKLNEGLEEKVQERTQQLARLAAVVDASDDAIVGATITGVVRSWNPGAERIYGYSAKEMIGNPSSILTPFDRPNDVAAVLERIRNGERIEQFETVRARKDGQQIPVSVTVSAIKDGAGKIDGVSVVTRDISKSRHMESSLRQAQKMEAVGRLAGGVAHDFNNLLGVIIGYSELILDQSNGDEFTRKHTEQIKKAGERAASLTRQLLAFSRQQVFETRVLNLNTIVADLEEMLLRLIGKNIELHATLDPGAGQVRADQGQIEQVLVNLVVNARDAMPEGGKLIIETSNVTLDDDYAVHHQPVIPGQYVMLAVCDTGTGMAPQVKTHIFEPFFTTKPQGQGTGLGLATVYGVVKQSGGYVWVYSEPGLGCTFKVYLPRVAAQVQDCQPARDVVDCAMRSETILLVEDERPLRTLTGTLLKKAGYTVLEAESGEQAIEVALGHAGAIQVLLTDMIMPGMDGRAAAQRLVSTRPEMRVVYMSGYIAFTQRGLLDPEANVLAKPFTRNALLQKLNEILSTKTSPPRTST